MAWVPALLLLLLAHRTGCGPQPVLIQPQFVSSSLGSTVHLACTFRSGFDVAIYDIHWYQQRPGHPPTFLLSYFSDLDNSHGSKIPARFSGSKDLAKNTGYLTISELRPEDEAVYYCAAWSKGLEPQKERARRDEKEGA
ncbi:Immunoglobulin iota chain [Manis javanica]|nr:Immunoglobulin iota chain [Manis javanica]